MTYTEDNLTEQPAIQLFESLGWRTMNYFSETFGEDCLLGRDNVLSQVGWALPITMFCRIFGLFLMGEAHPTILKKRRLLLKRLQNSLGWVENHKLSLVSAK